MRAFRSVGIASVWNGVNTLRPQSFSAWEPSGRRKISSNLRPLKLERRRARTPAGSDFSLLAPPPTEQRKPRGESVWAAGIPTAEHFSDQ
jgi:hypothetical protein